LNSNLPDQVGRSRATTCVRQLDAKHLQWCSDVFGKTEEWKTDLTERIPG
jgi:hypothetical protein